MCRWFLSVSLQIRLFQLDGFMICWGWLPRLDMAGHNAWVGSLVDPSSLGLLACEPSHWSLFRLTIHHRAHVGGDGVLSLDWISKLLSRLLEMLLGRWGWLGSSDVADLRVELVDTSLVFNLDVNRVSLLAHLILRAHLGLSWPSVHGIVHDSPLVNSSSITHEWILTSWSPSDRPIYLIALSILVHISVLLSVGLRHNASSDNAKSTRILALSVVILVIGRLLDSIELTSIGFHWATMVHRVVDGHMHHRVACILDLRTILLHGRVAWDICVLAQTRPKLTLGLVLRLDTSLFICDLVVDIEGFNLSTVGLLSILEILLLLTHQMVVTGWT